jgi:hypothetical protein
VDLSGGGANQVDDTSLGVVLTEYPPGFSFELVAPQAVAPVATVAADSWTAVGAPTVWEAVDETVASDAEYAESPDATATGHEMKLRFSSVSDPASGEGHILSWRYSKSALGGNVVKLIATLYRADGTTVVKTMTIENIEASVYGSFTLSVAEADSIPTGDYATGLVVGFKEVVV